MLADLALMRMRRALLLLVVMLAGVLMASANAATGRSDKKPSVRNVQRPYMSGIAVPGSRLLMSVGAWSGPLRAVTVRWERCSKTGLRCRVIVRRASFYRVRPADAGFALRVVVKVTGLDGREVESSSYLRPVRGT